MADMRGYTAGIRVALIILGCILGCAVGAQLHNTLYGWFIAIWTATIVFAVPKE